MARRVFFSFHYQRDIWRINQIRSIPNVTGCAAAGFQDASLWEEARKKSDATLRDEAAHLHVRPHRSAHHRPFDKRN
jgi:hypothetical protein